MLPFPPEEITLPIYSAIGQIVVHWALLEFDLDVASNVAFFEAGGRATIKETLNPIFATR
jgi:hypothetical protein